MTAWADVKATAAVATDRGLVVRVAGAVPSSSGVIPVNQDMLRQALIGGAAETLIVIAYEGCREGYLYLYNVGADVCQWRILRRRATAGAPAVLHNQTEKAAAVLAAATEADWYISNVRCTQLVLGLQATGGNTSIDYCWRTE